MYTNIPVAFLKRKTNESLELVYNCREKNVGSRTLDLYVKHGYKYVGKQPAV